MADTIYKTTRNNHGLTRDAVCDKASLMNNPIQPERLERIENERYPITPDEVMLLAEIYGEPTLCNYYCANECPIGKKYVPEIKVKDLAHIVLEMLASLNSIEERQARLIEITADGTIDDNEIKDFVCIQNQLERISLTIEAMQLWAEEMIADGKINITKYNEMKD